MTGLSFCLMADAQRIQHQFARLNSMTQWWHWFVLGVVCLVILAYVLRMYVTDGRDLPSGKRWALFTLRVAAFLAILFFFLDLERRSQQEVIKNSKVAVLADTSLSMGIQDATQSDGSQQRRVDEVVQEFDQGELLGQLRESHDVTVYRFGQLATPEEIASFGRVAEATVNQPRSVSAGESLRQARFIAIAAGALAGLGILCLFIHFVFAWRGQPEGSWALLGCIAAFLAASVTLAVSNLRYPEIDIRTTLGFEVPPPQTNDGAAQSIAEDPPEDAPPVAWDQELSPRGVETRLGDALRYLIEQERGSSLAGIVVLTDGGSNAGTNVEQAIKLAQTAGLPLYPVGIGSDSRPVNAKIADLETPPRVYPGDSFNVTGFVQSYGLEGRNLTVELLSRAIESGDTETAFAVEQEKSLRLTQDNEMQQVRFEVTPVEEGTREYQVRLAPVSEDSDDRDNERSARVEVVSRRNQVLLIAGGPSREFRFLRDQLYRDEETTSHVLLQSGQPGISQEADSLLYEFPDDEDSLFEYDAIVAFDVNWLDLSESQIDLLERWVSEKAGGLIVVAGPVHTPRWVSRVRSEPRLNTIKSIYPVVFYSRGAATLSLGRFASESPWPLEFTRDGRDAEFLRLEDDPLLSDEAWNSFEGVYGYYAVKEPKRGARVFAYFSDPNSAMDGELPIYLAAHFYGAGRVFFQASGEMWRVRAVSDAYFETYYTKLIRWVSQGRLLRDSNRGLLLVDKARCILGDQVLVRAILNDEQHRPLAMEFVTAVLVNPDGLRTQLVMRKSPEEQRAGTFSAQFSASIEGDYRIELQPPGGDTDGLLTREVQAWIPALETQKPERNDALLNELADKTEGSYFVGLAAAVNQSGTGVIPLANQIAPQDQVTQVAGSPDLRFDRLLMTWLMGIICGTLCLEWLIRRLNKLA